MTPLEGDDQGKIPKEVVFELGIMKGNQLCYGWGIHFLDVGNFHCTA